MFTENEYIIFFTDIVDTTLIFAEARTIREIIKNDGFPNDVGSKPT